jgi:hypothetical protein
MSSDYEAQFSNGDNNAKPAPKKQKGGRKTKPEKDQSKEPLELAQSGDNTKSSTSKIACGLGKNPGEMGGIAQQVYCALKILEAMKARKKLYVGYDDDADVSVYSEEDNKLSLYEVKYSSSIENLRDKLFDTLIKIKVDENQTLVICCPVKKTGQEIIEEVIIKINKHYYLDGTISGDDTMNPFRQNVFQRASKLEKNFHLSSAIESSLDEIFETKDAKAALLNQLSAVKQMDVIKVYSLNEWIKNITDLIKEMWRDADTTKQKGILVSLLISCQQMVMNRHGDVNLANLIQIPMGKIGGNKNKVDCLELKKMLDTDPIAFKADQINEMYQDMLMTTSLEASGAKEMLKRFLTFSEMLHMSDSSVDDKVGMIRSFRGSVQSWELDAVPTVEFQNLGFGTQVLITQDVCGKLTKISKKKILETCKIEEEMQGMSEFACMDLDE